jgi:hypothetical protein
LWLFFLLAGGAWRKRALQTVLLAIALCLPAILWFGIVSPLWLQELRGNLVLTSASGGGNNPTMVEPALAGAKMINLQTVFAVFNPHPWFYNGLTWLVCAPLFLAWSRTTLRTRFTPEPAWLALAAIASFTLLPTYHREHDNRVLLFLVPACALLWARRRSAGRVAALLTAAAAFLSANLVQQFIGALTRADRLSAHGFARVVLTLLLARTTPLILLALAFFFLVCFRRYAAHEPETIQESAPARTGSSQGA